MSRSIINTLLTCHWLTIGLAVGTAGPAKSQFETSAIPSLCDVNLNVLKSDASPDPNIITADNASAAGSTIPSLWWTSEQSPTRLVSNWIANRSQQQIYLLVNNNYWNAMDYVERYRILNRFGRVARDYGYDLKICNLQKTTLAGYSCGALSSDMVVNNIPNCQIWLNANSTRSGMGVNFDR
jgi:hypothetical protein